MRGPCTPCVSCNSLSKKTGEKNTLLEGADMRVNLGIIKQHKVNIMT